MLCTLPLSGYNTSRQRPPILCAAERYDPLEQDKPIETSIVIPAYNEEEAIRPVLDDVTAAMEPLGKPYEIIVVDDGSTDRTVERCQGRPQVRVISHDRNRGTGAARTTGVRAARGPNVVMIDADGTYPAEAIPPMLERLEHADMVIGARDREAGTVAWLRRLAKEFIRRLASYMVEFQIPDLNSGLRAMKRDVVLRFVPILPNTHSWVSTITMALLSSGYKVEWLPISYHKRIGHSTFHPIWDTYNYLTLVVRTIMYFNPLRIFLPLTVFLLAAGLIKAIADIFRFGFTFHVPASTVIIILAGIQVGAIGLLADLIVKAGRLRD